MKRTESPARSCIAAALAIGLGLCVSIPALGAVYVVRPDGTGDYATIQEAIDASVAGDVIELTTGVFVGPGNRGIQVPPHQITIRSQGGDPDLCVIDCEESARGIQVLAIPGTVIEGITITRGLAVLAQAGGLSIGGGYTGITVRDCVFHANTAFTGGAVGDGANSTFIRCRFIENSAVDGGAFFTNNANSPTLEDCTFIGNAASRFGGAVFLEAIEASFRQGRGAVFRGCLFSGNSAVGVGSIVIDGCSPTIENCTFVANSASHGVLQCTYALGTPANPLISHCIIAFSSEGAAVSCDAECSPTLLCCDVYGNEGGDWVGCLEGQLGVNGNIWADPLFCDREGGDFRLELGSPCGPEANPECGLIGALPVGCGPTPAQRCTWGGIKALFR
ncbi:MAG: right-handed parallel beta-helix repeat-containing protein [Candidatus Eisenbacteria sp.]|nr:right-handed parallel beta-helix repeat-containing protein [Candidatus Eisenbacteria bacterium]